MQRNLSRSLSLSLYLSLSLMKYEAKEGSLGCCVVVLGAIIGYSLMDGFKIMETIIYGDNTGVFL